LKVRSTLRSSRHARHHRRPTSKSYDVVIVGSGAGGGQTAYTLTMEGVKVLVMEAGRSFDVQTEVAMLQWPSQAPLRGEKTPDKQYGFHDCSINSGWDIPGEPYTNANKDTGEPVQVVAAAHDGWPHESLGPHLAAQWSAMISSRARGLGRALTGRSAMTISRPTMTRWRC
jgi:choline dehydrogenase-like flavoprotein